MSDGNRSTAWQRWVRQPQKVWLRRAIFQVHLWSGIGVGLYILFISVTGSVLVYTTELYAAATPEVGEARSGADGEHSWTNGLELISKLIELHDDLLAGPTGRKVNGAGALATLLLVGTGLVIWWRGAARWHQALRVHRGVGWKRFTWELHGMLGIWCFGVLLLFGLSGLYLCFEAPFQAVADWLEPETAENAGRRFVDGALYWLAYLHFGRIKGIGIPCSGPGLCDQATKAVWAIAGLTPAAMFVTGAIMWWNRVLRPRARRRPTASQPSGDALHSEALEQQHVVDPVAAVRSE